MWCEIELLDEDANRKWNFAHLNLRIKGEKCVVLDGRRDETNNLKAPLYFVTHEMCRKRAKEREREANYLFHFFPLNTFQLLFNLDRDILSFSLTRPMRHVSFHIKQKNNP